MERGPCAAPVEPALTETAKASAERPNARRRISRNDKVRFQEMRIKKSARGGFLMRILELKVGVEPTTCGLRNRCSTTELLQHSFF
jgi:hypothetical protein